MRNLFIGLSTLAIITAFAACSSSDSPTEENTKTGAKMPLTATTPGGTNYCVTGDIIITGTNPVRAAVTAPNATCGATNETILQPGEYAVTVPNPTCTSSLATPVAACELTPSPTPLTVTVGAVTTLPLAFLFSYENGTDENVLFGVGSARVTLGTVTSQERCGTGPSAPVCATTGQVCASLDGSTYDCYSTCTTTDATVLNQGSCIAGYMCTPVGAGTAATMPAASPLPTPIGTQGALNDTLHICNVAAAAAGAPSTGTAGAPSVETGTAGAAGEAASGGAGGATE